MGKLVLSINETTRAVKTEAPVMEVTTPEKLEVKGFKQKALAYWNILPGPKNGLIIARSNMGDTFEGAIKEFNRLMRG